MCAFAQCTILGSFLVRSATKGKWTPCLVTMGRRAMSTGNPFRPCAARLIRVQSLLAGGRPELPSGIREATSPPDLLATIAKHRLCRVVHNRDFAVVPTDRIALYSWVKAAPCILSAMTRRQSDALHCRFAGFSERSRYRGVKHLDFVTDRDRLKRAQA